MHNDADEDPRRGAPDVDPPENRTEPPPAAPLRLLGLQRTLVALVAALPPAALAILFVSTLLRHHFGLIAARIVGFTLAILCVGLVAAVLSTRLRIPRRRR